MIDTENLIAFLETYTQRQQHRDMPNWNPAEFAGFNYDETYELGVHDGMVNLAEMLLDFVKADVTFEFIPGDPLD